MAAEYPEIKAELGQIELSLEGFAMTDAPEVNPDILARLLTGTRSSTGSDTPVDKSPTIPAEKISRGVMASFTPWILVVGAVLGLLYFYSQAENQEGELMALQSQFDKLDKDCDESQKILQSTQQFINVLTSPATQDVILAGTDNAPDKSAIVFYNPATQTTLFKATNPPPPPPPPHNLHTASALNRPQTPHLTAAPSARLRILHSHPLPPSWACSIAYYCGTEP